MSKAASKRKYRPKPLPRESSPVQELIIEVLEHRGQSKYRLAQDAGLIPRKIYDKLYRPTSSRNLEQMLAALGARVMIGRHSVKLEIDDDGEVVGTVRA